jgi:hypothetical protein
LYITIRLIFQLLTLADGRCGPQRLNAATAINIRLASQLSIQMTAVKRRRDLTRFEERSSDLNLLAAGLIHLTIWGFFWPKSIFVAGIERRQWEACSDGNETFRTFEINYWLPCLSGWWSVRSADEKAPHKVLEIGGILLLWGSRPSGISPIIQSRWSGGLAVNETATSLLAFLPFKGWATRIAALGIHSLFLMSR